MRRVLLLLAIAACHSPPKQPPPPKQPVEMGEQIFALLPKVAKADEATRSDAALALGEVVIPGYAPRLRLIVSGDDPVLAEGAAKALVSIRLLRAPGPETLADCSRTETNALVRNQCVRMQSAAATPVLIPLDLLRQQLESSDTEQRRQALRVLLNAPIDELRDPAVTAAPVHGLDDADMRVRLLANAAFLRRTLQENAAP